MRLLVGLLRRGRVLGAWIRLAWVDGQPSAVLYDAKRARGQRGQAIRAVVNPGKLGHIGPVSDVARLPPAQNAQFRAPKYGHPANGDPVQNGGYRVLTVTSNCDAALPLLKSVSELDAGSARRQDSLTWMKIARRSTSSVRDRHHRGGHDHRGDGGVAVRKPTGPYPDAPPAPRPEQPQRGRAAGPWGSNG